MARKVQKSVPEMERELLDLEMLVFEMDLAKRRRAAWPKYWPSIDEVFPVSLPKTQVTLRLDTDVLDWFRGQGRGHQTRMNAVLRAYMLTKATKLDCAG